MVAGASKQLCRGIPLYSLPQLCSRNSRSMPTRKPPAWGALRSAANRSTHRLTRDAERETSRRCSFLGPLSPVFASSPRDLGLAQRAKRARTAYPKERPSRRHGPPDPAKTLRLSISTPRHGVTARYGIQARLSTSLSRHRVPAARGPASVMDTQTNSLVPDGSTAADGSRWEQMEDGEEKTPARYGTQVDNQPTATPQIRAGKWPADLVVAVLDNG